MSYPMSTDRVPTRTVVLRGKMRRPKQPLTNITDVSGNPSETVCSKTQLDNILAARDEFEARKLRAVKR